MNVETKTQTGMKVILSENGEWVRAELHHPQFGIIAGNGKWDSNLKTSGLFLRNVEIKGKKSTICLQIPKADYDEVMAVIINKREETSRIKQEKHRQEALYACPKGYVIARQIWSNGDLMSAEYETEDSTRVIASDLLDAINGWYFISNNLVEAAKKAEEKKAEIKTEREKKENERIADIKALASQTGEKQELHKKLVECNQKDIECSTDIITIWAMPDGSTKTTRTHTY